MALPRFHRLTADKKEELLQIATREFVEHGFEGASLNDILEKAGFSKSSYYYYFEDKEDLFATVLDQVFTRFIERLPLPSLDTLTEKTFWPAIDHYLADSLHLLAEAPEIVKLAAHMNERVRANPRFAPLMERGRSIHRALIESGRRVGCVREDVPVEFLISLVEVNDAFLDAYLFSRTSQVTLADIETHARLAYDTYRRLLVPAEAPAPARKRGRKVR